MAIANDPSSPMWQRALHSLQAFSGTQLTGLPARVKRAIETHFVAVNRVLDKYDLETSDDYEQVAEADLQEILGIVKDLAAKIGRAKLGSQR